MSLISNCGHNESGKLTGGNPGEQGRGNVAKSDRLCGDCHYWYRAWLGCHTGRNVVA